MPPGAWIDPPIDIVSASLLLRFSSVPNKTLAPASVRILLPFSITISPRASIKSVVNGSSAPVAANLMLTGLRSPSRFKIRSNANLPFDLRIGANRNCSATGSKIEFSTMRIAGM